MPIPSLQNLCIFNSLGSSNLSESCLEFDSNPPTFSNPKSRWLPNDLIEKINPIINQFNICM